MEINEGKEKIDTLIKNARFRCHRPIRVAEILYHSRTNLNVDLNEAESYRVESARWRDEISRKLTGKGSSSSRSYQKDFSNLISTTALQALDKENREKNGIVENYIYHRLREDKWKGLIQARDYVQECSTDEFSLEKYIGLAGKSGLQEDSMLEISVFAIFSALADKLEAKAKLELEKVDKDILEDFKDFTKIFMGFSPEKTSFETLVSIYRPGKGTYAADKGVDIGTNFGTMVQVKYVTLSESKVKDIDERSYAEDVVVVCKDADEKIIKNVANQLGFDKVKAIVTLSDLINWYNIAFEKYEESLGKKILYYLHKEFGKEFRRGNWKIPDMDNFIVSRNYKKENLEGIWIID